MMNSSLFCYSRIISWSLRLAMWLLLMGWLHLYFLTVCMSLEGYEWTSLRAWLLTNSVCFCFVLHYWNFKLHLLQRTADSEAIKKTAWEICTFPGSFYCVNSNDILMTASLHDRMMWHMNLFSWENWPLLMLPGGQQKQEALWKELEWPSEDIERIIKSLPGKSILSLT